MTQQERKDPWLAVLLSKVYPGIGHIYGGATGRGIVFISLMTVSFATSVAAVIAFLVADDAQSTRTFGVVSLSLMFMMTAVSICAYFDAYRVTKRLNPEEVQVVTVIGNRKAWLAAFLSAILPGIGQLYNRQIMKGLGMLVLAFAAGVLTSLFTPFFIGSFLVGVLAVKDAYDSAERINGSSGRFFENNMKIVLLVLVMLGLESMPIAYVIKSNFVEAFKMPSGSMMPSMVIGDHFLIGKSRPFFTAPRRGDIVVFPYPENPEKNFVKRVIGLGGDKIQIVNGELYLNDVQVQSRLIGTVTKEVPLNSAGYGPPTEYEERIGDAVYRVQYLRDRSTINAGPWLIPQDSVFVMGDNRDNSQDSRHWGPVQGSTVRGKALKIYWSWDRSEYKIRWDRIGEMLH